MPICVACLPKTAKGDKGMSDEEQTSPLLQVVAKKITEAAEAADSMTSPTPGSHVFGASDKHKKSGTLMTALIRRTRDPKGLVRKAAVQAIEAVAVLDGYEIIGDEIQAIHNTCLDPTVSVRKQAINSFTLLLNRFPTSELVQRMWLTSVLPLAMDGEEGVVKLATEIINSQLLQPVTAGGDENAHLRLAWNLLKIMDQKQDLSRYLRRLCALWHRAGILKPKMVKNLVAHVCHPDTIGGWSLLADLAAFKPDMIQADAILAAWDNRVLDDLTTTTHILTTIASIAPFVESNRRVALSSELQDYLLQFTAAASLISIMMNCICKLSSVDNEATTPQQAFVPASVRQFATKLLQLCEKRLGRIVFSKDPVGSYDEVSVIRQLFTLGETTLICPEAVTDKQTLVVQALMAKDVPGLSLHDESVSFFFFF